MMRNRYQNWRKAKASNDGNGCFELCFDVEGTIAVRDSKLGEDSPILEFSRHEFDCFKAGIIAGEF